MKTLLFLITLSLIPGECYENSIRVTAQLGASVTITCRYPDKYTNNNKSFCLPVGNSCKTLVSLEPTSTEARTGRYSLTYNREERALNVTIDGLMKNDEAVYSCAVRTEEGNITRVRDVVVYVMANTARSVHFRCPYDHSYDRNPKHFYRGECSRNGSPEQKDLLIQTNQSDILISRGRYRLYDNTTTRVFTVTITNLTVEDSGKYCCVVKREPIADIQKEHLLIFDENFTSSEIISGRWHHNVSSVNMTVWSVTRAVLTFSLFICIIIFSICMWQRRAPTVQQNSDRNTVLMHRLYQSPNPASVQQVADYQNQNLDPNPDQQHHQDQCLASKSPQDPLYQCLDPDSRTDSVYQRLDQQETRRDCEYQSLDLKSKSGDSVYQSLDLKSKPDDKFYQSLDLKSKPGYSVYQSLDPSSIQPDSLYQETDLQMSGHRNGHS